MTINELKDKRMKLFNDAKAFVESKRQENGTLLPEDDKAYDKMESDILTLGKEISRLEKQEALDRELSRPTTEALVSSPILIKDDNKIGRASDEYKKAMLDALRTKFRKVSDVLREGSAADGGYLVPEEYDERLIETLDEENVMRKLSTTITTSGEHKINIAGSKPAASWVEEGEALSWGDAKFEQKLMDAHKLHVGVQVSEELLYDNSYDLVSYLTKAFGNALANAEEDAFINGDGNGRPTGILDKTKGGTFSLTSESASDISADEIINLVYTLKRPYRKNAKFLMNDQTIASIRKLKDGNGQYIWQPSFVQGEPDKLLGYDVYTSAYFPKMEAGKPVVAFGDFSYYNIGDRGVRSFDELRELFAGNGLVGFLAKERVDGLLVLKEAIQILSMKTSTKG